MSRNGSSLSNSVGKSIEVMIPTNEVFQQLFQTKKWCDLTIIFGSKSFSVHRCIICSAMPYFDTMMSSEFKESLQNHVTLDLPIDIGAFECLIKWAYSFKIIINSTNVHSLLVASDYLRITQVFETCCEYLDSVLNIKTALEIKGIIKNLEVGKLASKATALIIRNFAVISKTNEWFELPIEVLTKYLEDGDVVGFDENEIIDAIIRWAEFSPDSRQEHLSSLLKLVKWKFVDPTIMVKKVASHELVKGNESCRKLLHEVFEFMMFQCTESSSTSYWKSPRVHKYNVEVIMAFVKLSGKLQCFIQTPYSSAWKQWMNFDMDPGNKLWVVATEEYLHIQSYQTSLVIHLPSKTQQKTESNKYINNVTASSKEVFITEYQTYNSSLHISKSIQYSPSDHRKCDVSTGIYLDHYGFVYLNNALYFIGGITKDKAESIINKLQKYDIAQSKWTLLTPMSSARKGPHVVALDGKIYVIGGTRCIDYISGREVSVRSAEYYDPNLDKWFNMPFPVSGHLIKFVIAFCSKLYAFTDEKLKTVQIYDPKTGTWRAETKDSCCENVLSVISIPNLASLTFD